MRERRCGGAHEQSLSDGDRHTDNSTCFVVGRGGLQEQASSLRLAPAEAFKCDQQSGTCTRKARSKRRNDHPGRPGHTLRGRSPERLPQCVGAAALWGSAYRCATACCDLGHWLNLWRGRAFKE